MLVGECNVTFFMIGYPSVSTFFNTTPLFVSMHFTALGLGLGSWAVCALTKLTGPKLISKMPLFGEDQAALDSANSFNDRAMEKVKIGGQNADEDGDGVAD